MYHDEEIGDLEKDKHLLNYTNLIILMLVAFFINLPFGYIRGPCKKFSFKWFLYIHISIPVIILLRHHYGFGIIMISVTIPLAVMGQIVGSRYYKRKMCKKGAE